MKNFKKALLILLAVLAAGALVFILMAHGDEPVTGVAIADEPVTDPDTMDGILSSAGTQTGGFDGALYTVSTQGMGKYTVTTLAPAPQGQAVYASVLFNSSPQGISYRAVWTRDGVAVKEESRTVTVTTKIEALCYTLDAPLVQKGEYTFAVYYADKQIYTQTFTVG